MLSKRLKSARKMRKMSQEDLAKKINTTKSIISNYENEYSSPSNEVLTRIADVLDVTTDYLLGRTDNPKGHVDFDPIAEHNRLLKKYGIEDSGFFDIEKWKQMGPEELKQLENYFKFIVEQAKQREKEDKDSE